MLHFSRRLSDSCLIARSSTFAARWRLATSGQVHSVQSVLVQLIEVEGPGAETGGCFEVVRERSEDGAADDG